MRGMCVSVRVCLSVYGVCVERERLCGCVIGNVSVTYIQKVLLRDTSVPCACLPGRAWVLSPPDAGARSLLPALGKGPN